jgi:PAS domain S-box-containing protein
MQKYSVEHGNPHQRGARSILKLFEYSTRYANDIILITDKRGQIIEANERAINTYGYLHEELLQMNIENLRDSKKSPSYESVQQKVALENGYIYETWHMRRDGTSFPVESSIRQIQVHDKFYYQVIVRDITRRKRAEAAAKEAHYRLLKVLDSMDAGIYVADMETYEILFANHFTQNIHGNVIGEKCWRVFHKGQKGPCSFCTNHKLIDADGQPTGVYQWEFNNTKTGRWYECRDSAIKWTDDRIVRLEIATDVTDRKQAEKALRESEAAVRKKLKAILEPEGDLSTLHLADIIDHHSLQSMMEDFHRATNIGSAIIDLSGNILVAVGWQDVCVKYHRKHPETRQKCIESDVILSNGVPAGTFKAYRCKNNMWDMVTPIEIDGRHRGNIFLGQFFFENEVPAYDIFRNQARQYGFDEEKYLAAIDCVPRWSHETVEAVMAFYAKLAAMISSLSYSKIKLSRAISQQKATLHKLNESEERLRLAQKATNDVIWDWDIVNDSQLWNESGTEVFGWTDIVKHPQTAAWWVKRVHPEDRQRVEKDFFAVVNDPEKNHWQEEYRFFKADGSYAQVIDRAYVLRTAQGKAIRMIGAMLDITERVQAEKIIKTSLKEKETLLKEIHHRVKNNMQVISSLLNLQIIRNKDEKAKQALMDCQGRIKSMASVHEMLYMSENLSVIDCHTYISKLARDIFQSYHPGSHRVKLTVDATNIGLGIQQASPLGLIINELLSNSLKYGFPEKEHGQIIIRLKVRKPNIVEFVFSDNGIGIPKELDWRNTKSLGLNLVVLLAENQLDGTIKLDREKGTCFTITFSLENNQT